MKKYDVKKRRKSYVKKKKKPYSLTTIFTVSGFLAVFFWLVYLYITAYKNSNTIEYVTKFNGTIKSINQTKGTTFVLLENENQYWSIDASYNYDYQYPFIADFLDKNDILAKKSCSDTLFVTRKNKKYHFIIGDALYNSKSHTMEYKSYWNRQRRIIKEKDTCK
ncbi:hypothetical protein [Winogradskyella rapida]|uniref:Uncharacterized protein n=1 Tax=Winogradskyella rapida TaxID=549701 RepID=A0ABW3KPW1_9FLAO